MVGKEKGLTPSLFFFFLFYRLCMLLFSLFPLLFPLFLLFSTVFPLFFCCFPLFMLFSAVFPLFLLHFRLCVLFILPFQMWLCQEKDTLEVSPAEHGGVFYSRDSYIFLFEFMTPNREGPGERVAYALYFWLGDDAKASEKGTASLLAVEIDKQYGAPQIRVVQGKEPEDFVAIFGNKMMTREGAKKDFDAKKTALFHVRGSAPFAVRAEQTGLVRFIINVELAFRDEQRACQNSGFIFYLIFLWEEGKGCI